MAPTRASQSILQLIHRRRHLTAACLLLIMALALVAALRLTPLAVMTSPLLGAALFLVHGALDPSRDGFLFHRRLRLIGLGLTLAAAVSIGFAAPSGATPPLLFALAIAVRHYRCSCKLHREAQQELDQLCAKIASLESRRALELRLSGFADEAARDKAPKAG